MARLESMNVHLAFSIQFRANYSGKVVTKEDGIATVNNLIDHYEPQQP